MGRAPVAMLLCAAVMACAPVRPPRYYGDEPPPVRWAMLDFVDVRDGRDPGSYEVTIGITGEQEGLNPFRMYRMPGRGEVWVDLEWTALPAGPVATSLAPGSEELVRAVRFEQFAADSGRESLCRVILEIADPRGTAVHAPLTGQASDEISLRVRSADRGAALLSPSVEADLVRGGRGGKLLGSLPSYAVPNPKPSKKSKKSKMSTKSSFQVLAELRFERALARAPTVVLARAESTELPLLDSLPPELPVGSATGYPGGGRVSWRVEAVVRGKAPEVVVLELPVCRPKPVNTDCFSIDHLRTLTRGQVVLMLGSDSSSSAPALAGKAEESIWVADVGLLQKLGDRGK